MDATTLFDGIDIVPVVTIDDVDLAVPLAEALLAAGVRAIEITLRTEHALAAVERVARAVPGLVIGAGSLRRPDQFPRIVAAGAQFAVSPGATERLLTAAREAGLPFVPGAVTASEILRLLEHDYRLVKFFPAESSGGLAQLRALAAPLPEVQFFPTGGITLELARDYLAFERVACIGGSWFVPPDALRERNFQQILRLAGEAVAEATRARRPLRATTPQEPL